MIQRSTSLSKDLWYDERNNVHPGKPGRKVSMKLFDIVPANFFSILVSPNREIYFDALMLLHEESREKLNIEVEDFVSSLIFLLEDRAFEREEDDEAGTDYSPSGKARLILDRFVKTGWVEREFLENSFVEIITPRQYALKIMKLLSEIGDATLEEYNSLVFSTYSGLNQAMTRDEEHLYEAVLSARTNTEELQYSLRRLYHGIRGYLRSIVSQQEVNLLLTEHFEEFRVLSDRLYHPIKTMDSVHRYMNPIQTLVSGLLADETRLEAMTERAMHIRQYEDPQEARMEITMSLDNILEAYAGLDALIGEVDRKHSSYTKNSVEKIRYLMTADQTIRSKLVQLLKGAASRDETERDLTLKVIERGITVNRQEYFDAGSLYRKTVRMRRIQREALPVEADGSLSDAARQFFLEQIQDSYPLSRIRAYAESLFQDGRSRVASRDVPLSSDTDFILLILAVVRQGDPGMPYTIEMGDGRVDVNGYRIPQLTFIKKGE